jgi:hypothetical protein
MKYGEKNLPKIVKAFLKSDQSRSTPEINIQLLGASLAQSTWKRYKAVLKTWRLFNSERGVLGRKSPLLKGEILLGGARRRGNLNQTR